MFRSLSSLLIALSMLAAVATAQTDTITVLHLNDTHANLAPLGPRDAGLAGTVGGIARAATVIGMTKMENPSALVLHAGDISIGDLFYTKYFDVAELQILLSLGVDAMTPGNHEFDLGPLYFQQMLDTAFAHGSFPLLSANAVMTDPSVAGLNKYILPSIIKTVGSTKVGIFGLTTPATNLLSNPAPVTFDEEFPVVAAAMVDTLQKQGCSVIICLSHLGAGYDQVLAGMVPGINLIVGGHDHYQFTRPVAAVDPAGDTTWIVQAESFYKAIGQVRLTRTGSAVRLLDYTYIPLDAGIPEEPTTAAVIAGLIAGIEGTYGPMYTQQVATVSADLEEVADSLTSFGPKDTPIGNLVADAYRLTLGTQIGIQAGGSTAHPLYHGPIVGADVFRVVGYGFNTDNGLGYHLATFSMTGAALLAGLEFGVSEIEIGDEYLLQVSGLTYCYDPTLPVFGRIFNVKVGGVPIDSAATYTVAANEFIPMFLGAMEIPFADLRVFAGDTTEFQVLLQAIMTIGTLTPATSGRIRAARYTFEDVGTTATTPDAFHLGQNYPNPFNPTTMITYSLPVAAMVRLSVFDILGREVATLVNGQCQAGAAQVVWNGRDGYGNSVSSGMYFYRLEARPVDGSPIFASMRKMLLLK
jgi:5'-nucleotidase / UDP-sugar diphosphatase